MNERTRQTLNEGRLTQNHRDMVCGIETVLEGMRPEFEEKKLTIPVEMVKTHMEAKGWSAGELETNGWQYDWWMTFTKGKQSFTASGSGYHGGFCFAPTED